jgi:hypothetical protein
MWICFWAIFPCKFFCFVSDELACNSKDVHGYCVTKLSECDGNVKNYTEIYIGK